MNLRPLLIGAIATCILALTAGLGLVYTLHRVVADLPAGSSTCSTAKSPRAISIQQRGRPWPT